jgi:hypothetical protein
MKFPTLTAETAAGTADVSHDDRSLAWFVTGATDGQLLAYELGLGQLREWLIQHVGEDGADRALDFYEPTHFGDSFDLRLSRPKGWGA